MKKIVAALSLATLLAGGTAVFANTTNAQTPAPKPEAKTAPARHHRRGKKSHKPATNTPATPKPSK